MNRLHKQLMYGGLFVGVVLFLVVFLIADAADKFIIGDRVVVASTGAYARATPSLSGTTLQLHPSGDLGTVTGGPTTANSLVWWTIDYDTGSDGWTTEPNINKVVAPVFNFNMTNGGNKSVAQGSSVSNTITSTLSAGAAASVSLSASGLPSGATAIFSPTSCSPTCISDLTITTTGSTPVGNSIVTVTATGGSLNKSTTFTLSVTAPLDTTSPTVSITAPLVGATLSGTVTVTANAADNVAVAGVQFILDGSNLLAEDTTAPYSVSWNTTTATNASHTLTATARDSAGNTVTSASRIVTVSNIVTTNKFIIGDRVVVASTGAYARATPSLSGTTLQLHPSGDLGTVTGGPTAANSIIWWNINYDTGSDGWTSEPNINKSTSPPIDTTSPTISMTSPAVGATLSGTVSINANAADNVAVAGVQFILDGTNLLAEDTTAPYSVSWNTTTATNATHSITAIARDTSNNTAAVAALVVNVNNAVVPPPPDITSPTVSMTFPAIGAILSGTVNVTANAADNIGVTGVQFKLDGINLGTEDLITPYLTSWNTTTSINGAHSLTAVARDVANNTGTVIALPVTVTNAVTPPIDTTSPTVSITSPLVGATLSGSVPINANAADNIAVAGVQFKVDGINVGAEDTAAPYSVLWDTGTVANGAHNLIAVARDTSNNTATVAAVVVNVNNNVSPLPPPPPPGTYPWSGIIAPTRATDWSQVGVPGGIPNRTTVCATLGTAGQAPTSVQNVTAAQINSAIASCPAGQVVMLETGTYNGLGAITFAGHNNVTLRGRGANSTILNFSGGGTGCNGLGAHVCMIPTGTTGWNQDDPGTVANWTAGYAKGATQITLSSVAGLAPGRLIVVDRIDDATDPGGDVWICSGTNCTEQGTDIGRGSGANKRGQSEIHTVVSVSGNVVTINPPLLHPNWGNGQSPQAWWANSAPATGMGIENLSLNYTNSTAQYGLQMQMCDGCWVKGIRSINARNAHVNMYLSSHVTIRDSYFYGSQAAASQSYGFEPWMGGNHLWENNIFQHQATPMLSSGASNIVAAYNYALDDYYCNGGCQGWFQSAMYHHESGSSYILWESNNVPGMTGDNIHGPGVFSTAFRNRIDGKDPLDSDNKTAQTIPVNLSARYRFFNIIGNVLGTMGYHNTYQVNTTTTGSQSCGAGGDTAIYRLGWAGNCNNGDGPGDPTVDDVMMRWGNYDTVNNAVRWLNTEVPTTLTKYSNGVPASQFLPASFYLSGQPSFWSTPWGTPPFPAIGPDVNGGNIVNVGGHAYKIPAQLCYENTSKTGSILNFNADACY